MKTNLSRFLLTCTAMSFGFSAVHAELLAHWPLDTDADDATGNGHDGTVVGGTVEFGQPGANGNTGMSASFPDQGHIDVPYTAVLNPGGQGADASDSFTIALWANSSDNSGFNSPFTAREDNGTSVNGPIIYNNDGGNWSYWAGNGGPPGAWNAIDDGPVPLDTWQHVAITYDADTTTRKMFVDGVEVINEIIGVSANGQRDIHIGSGQDDGNNFFWNGLIDDVGIWDEALDQAEIEAVMNDGIGGGAADPNLRAPATLELDYNGVDGGFSIPIDNTGATQDLNIIGTPAIGGDDAANFSVVSVPGPVAPGDSATIEANFDPMGGNGVFEATFDIESDDSVNPNTVVTVRMTFHDPFVSAPAVIDFGSLPTGSGPQTITVTLENLGASELMISDITVGGEDADNFTLGAFSNVPGEGMIDLEVTFNPAGAEGGFNAQLEIMSDDPITPTLTVPITARTEFSSPLIAHWPLDSDASDATGNGFDGEVVGGTVNFGQPGANANTGTAAEFPDNGHIDIPYDPALNPGEQGAGLSESFSITVWTHSTDNSGYNSPFTSREDSGTVNGPIIYNNPNGNWSYWAGNNGPPGAWQPLDYTAETVPTNTWQHVAVTYDSETMTRKMFIDGEEVLSADQGVSANMLRDTHIGAGQDDGNNFFWNGLLDDVGLFRVALSQEEIQAIMDNGVASVGGRPKLPFSVEATGSDMLTLRWDSQGGKLYSVRSETDPASAEPLDWPIYDGNEDITATPPENTLTIPRPSDPFRLFIIEEYNAPPVSVFFDDFESGQGGWTSGSDGEDGTAWEFGTPGAPGPAGANSPTNAFGTNLTSVYGLNANVWLRSPPIDLTTAGGATLRYASWYDIEQTFDSGTVNVLDAADDSLLGPVQSTIEGTTTDWEPVTALLPPAALGKTIKIEFRLESDDFQNFAGWYVDDVEVTIP